MSQSNREHFDQCLKLLMQHLAELRPILNIRNLDDQAINKAHEFVRDFVVSEMGAGASGPLFVARTFTETGAPRLGKYVDGDGPHSTVPAYDENGKELVTEEERDLIDMVLTLLVGFAQPLLSRARKEIAIELCDSASDLVEYRTGKPWNSRSKFTADGVSEKKLQAAFEYIKEHGPVFGKSVAQHIKVDADSFRGRYVRLLKERFGVQNKRGKGYVAP